VRSAINQFIQKEKAWKKIARKLDKKSKEYDELKR